MGTFTVVSPAQSLFGSNGEFKAEVKIEATRNVVDNTYTVKVLGIRGYSKLGWDFGQRIIMWLGTTAAGADKVSKPSPLSGTSNYLTITRSGSNYYTGWLPRTGYASYTFSKTYKGNADGSCPAVWLYFTSFNPTVYWINNGVNVAASTTYKGNIKKLVEEASNGPNDRRSPTVTLKATDTSDTSVTFKATTDMICDKWKYALDTRKADAFKQYSTVEGKSTTKKVTFSGSDSHIVYVKARRAHNHVWSDVASLKVDALNPRIDVYKLTATSYNTAQLKLKCNQKCTWKLKDAKGNIKATGNIDANKLLTQSVDVRPREKSQYTITVVRTSNTNLKNSAKTLCDTITPTISDMMLVTAGPSQALLTFKLSHSCNCKLVSADAKKVYWTSTASCIQQQSKKVSVQLNADTEYILHVQRADNANLSSSCRLECDTRVPIIVDPILTPSTQSTSLLQFTSVFPGSWVLTSADTDGKLASGTITRSEERVQQEVLIKEGTNSLYKLTVYKTSPGNAILSTYVNLLSDNIPPKTRITLTKQLNQNLYFKAEAESKATCNWVYLVRDEAGAIRYRDIATHSTSIARKLSTLPPGRYTLKVEGCKASNGLIDSDTTEIKLEPLWGFSVLDKQEGWRQAKVHILLTDKSTNTKVWKPAIPYILEDVQGVKTWVTFDMKDEVI